MKIIKRVIPLFVSAIVFYSCANNESKTVNETNDSITTNTIEINTSLLLIPGRSTGKISLGQNAEEVYVQLGKADAGNAIGVSSTIDEIQKKYAVTKLTDISDSGSILKMYDSLKGIAFETDEKGICQAIIIHNSEEALKTTSLPLR